MSVVKGAAANVDGFWSVPASWAWTTVETVGGVGLGRQRSPENHSGPYMRQYVRAANISWSGWELSDVLSMNFDPDDFERFRLHPGDVLLNEGSGSSAEVGKSAIWRGQIEDCCFQNTLLRVQPKAVSPEFLQFYFIQAARSGRFVPETQGVNIFHIGKAGLAKFPVPVPPPDEQRRIVAKLDSLRARSTRARNELDHIPKLIERYKQAILAKLYHEATENADAVASLGDLALEVRNGLSRKPEPSPPGVPILRISAVRPGRVRLDQPRYYRSADGERLDTYALRNGDLLFTRYNGNPELVAVCGLVRGLAELTVYPDKLIRVRLDNERVLPEFVELIAQAPQARRQLEPHIKTAAGQHGISGRDLQTLTVPVAPVALQNAITKKATAAFAWLDKITTEHARAEHLLPKLDQAILAQAFRGELVPQDPNDEPASELLQRIKTDVRGGASRKRQ